MRHPHFKSRRQEFLTQWPRSREHYCSSVRKIAKSFPKLAGCEKFVLIFGLPSAKIIPTTDRMIAGFERMLVLTTGKTEYPDLKPCSGAKRIDWRDRVGLRLQAAVHVRARKSPARAPIGA
jgi:hypothetical protein